MHAPWPHNLIVEILPAGIPSTSSYVWPRRPESSTEFFTVIDKEEQIDAVYRRTITEPFAGEIRLARIGLNDQAENVVDTLLVLDPLLLMILIFLGDRLMGTILSPLKRLTGTAQTLSLSAMPQPIPLPEHGSEMQALIAAFNAMTVRLKDGADLLERFNHDVSHELKTPLTVIRGEIELAQDDPDTPETIRRTLAIIAKESGRIQHITESLLLLSTYTPASVRETFVPCDIDTLLIEVVDTYAPVLRAKNLTLNFETIEPVNRPANPVLLRSCFGNLLDNAIKYTPKGKQIHLSLTARDGRAHCVIRDEGIGIPADQLGRITERFYRIDAARSRQIPGSGLGLALVKNSIELHGGTLTIESEEGKGTVVRVVV
jgi:signal transduction histidine kinase